MGWSSGTSLFWDIWPEVRKHIPETNRVVAVTAFIRGMEAHDWDCQSEAVHESMPEVEAALRELHPHWYEDEKLEGGDE